MRMIVMMIMFKKTSDDDEEPRNGDDSEDGGFRRCKPSNRDRQSPTRQPASFKPLNTDPHRNQILTRLRV